MTTEQAIEELKSDRELYGSDIVYAGDETPEGDLMLALDMGIAALKKQIPKQSKYEDVDNVYGAIKRTCTACGDVCMVSKGAKPYEHYCRQCGQALDWSGDCE